MRGKGPESSREVTSEQLFQMSYLADQYRQDGKPGYHRRAYILEGSLAMHSMPTTGETIPTGKSATEPITVYEG